MQYKTRANRIFHFVNIFILAVVSLLCVLPFINLLAISFSDSAAVAAGAVGFTPVDFTLSAYEYALKVKSTGVNRSRGANLYGHFSFPLSVCSLVWGSI